MHAYIYILYATYMYNDVRNCIVIPSGKKSSMCIRVVII